MIKSELTRFRRIPHTLGEAEKETETFVKHRSPMMIDDDDDDDDDETECWSMQLRNSQSFFLPGQGFQTVAPCTSFIFPCRSMLQGTMSPLVRLDDM
ncbi:hypothetical protein PABG_07205 [Paracoccidioides brasiliensis Pb03]|nr:hypothetical protein PABG_07205 [Paracoccidioides brasiliensis Pb03]